MERGGSRRGDVTKEQERRISEKMLSEAGEKVLKDTGRKTSDRQLRDQLRPEAQEKVHFSVIVRCPFRRGDFEEPGPVIWDAEKDEKLWSIVSGAAKSADLNWDELADHFDVPLTFMLQQAAWLYERHLSHVRAQMKKRQTAQPSAGNSTTTAGGVPMKRGGSNTGRAPSALSRDSPRADTSAPPTPRMGVEPAPPLSRNPSTTTVTQSRQVQGHSSPRPAAAQLHRDPQPRPRPQAAVKPLSPPSPSSPSAASSSSDSSSEDDEPGPMSKFRRPPTFKPHRSALGKALASSTAPRKPYDDSDNDESTSSDDDAPSGLPFVSKPPGQQQDPGATLRSGLPKTTRRSSDVTETGQGDSGPFNDKGKGKSTAPSAPSKTKAAPVTDSSASSASSAAPLPGFVPVNRPSVKAQTAQARARAGGTGTNTGTGSPASSGAGSRHLRQPGGRGPGSEGGASMGSSFSDLDDPSVTQSALEEALLQAGQGGVASKMSSLSQALRSRYL